MYEGIHDLKTRDHADYFRNITPTLADMNNPDTSLKETAEPHKDRNELLAVKKVDDFGENTREPHEYFHPYFTPYSSFIVGVINCEKLSLVCNISGCIVMSTRT